MYYKMVEAIASVQEIINKNIVYANDIRVSDLKLYAEILKLQGCRSLRKGELINKLTNVGVNFPTKKKPSSSICECGKVKYSCRNCGGSQICIHNCRKSRCKKCNGGSLCEHGRIRYLCNQEQCNGKGICIHGKQKFFCKLCGGSQICSHGRQKSNCKECRV